MLCGRSMPLYAFLLLSLIRDPGRCLQHVHWQPFLWNILWFLRGTAVGSQLWRGSQSQNFFLLEVETGRKADSSACPTRPVSKHQPNSSVRLGTQRGAKEVQDTCLHPAKGFPELLVASLVVAERHQVQSISPKKVEYYITQQSLYRGD